MEEFRVCTVEAQAATEDIREEISTVISGFNLRHQNVRLDKEIERCINIRNQVNVNLLYFQYEDLNKMVTSAQNYLARTREGLIEVINRLELQVIFICNILKYMLLSYDGYH